MTTGNGKASVCYVHELTEAGYNWHRSYLKLVVHSLTTEGSPVRGDEIPIKYPTGGLVEARNAAVDKFLATDNEWLFWVDTDMGYDGDVVDRLVAAADPVKRPVMGALCFTRREVGEDGLEGRLVVPHPTIYQWTQTPQGAVGFVTFDNYPKGTVIRCGATGSACMVIHRSVFEAIAEKSGPNWYGLIACQDKSIGEAYSEDISFCLRCRSTPWGDVPLEHPEGGIPIHVDSSIQTNHLKEIWWSEQMFDVFRAAAGKTDPLSWVGDELAEIHVPGSEEFDEISAAFDKKVS